MATATASTKRAGTRGLLRRLVSDAERLRDELRVEAEADAIAQAAVCAVPILAFCRNSDAALSWLNEQLAPWERIAIAQAKALSTQYSVLSPQAAGTCAGNHDYSHLYDEFFQLYARDKRKRGGVFFTPRPVADYIVAGADRLLREKCKIDDGITSGEALLLDPACGTGVFLLSLIDHARPVFQSDHRWSRFVPGFLSRLRGIEILPAAALLAKLNIALKLAETGYDFAYGGHLSIATGDALSPTLQSEIRNLKCAIPVLLGNPPFSSLTTQSNAWIARLVRGDEAVRGYVRANGESLSERKTWLHDDYVKFIRLAQWHIEEAGQGIVGFITNHGYLDNATFRLMRHELLRVFPHIEILDLHGNRKKHEVSADGGRDENVFGLDQGVAIGFFCRPPGRRASEGKTTATIARADLWGTRREKLDALASSIETAIFSGMEGILPSLALRATDIAPRAPDWRFIPAPTVDRHPEYDAAWSLADAMPVNSTAPVTARDHFVVAFTEAELKQRVEIFRDLSISDDEIRRRYFTRTRSARYEMGDTRGWKLSAARRAVSDDSDWQSRITRCLYRPFDWRYVFWHPAMIDWPRHEITRHLVGWPIENQKSKIENLTLIARRQQLPTQPCTFFWIADCLTLDGVIRSDNRGSESLFPLYLRGDGIDDQPRANFESAFVEEFINKTKLTWLELDRGDLERTFGPEDLLAYIYALFHSSQYRDRYAESLRQGFPRVVPPRNGAGFSALATLGSDLIEAHLQNSVTGNPDSAADPAIANFRAGGHVVLRKWLQPSHRSPADLEYQQIAAAIARTIKLMQEIDQTIEAAGGFS